MKLPDNINIMSTNYTVNYINERSELDPVGLSILDGVILFDINEIRVYNKLDKETKFKTLFHEMVHGIVREMNIWEIQDHENSERIVDSVAIGLFDTLIRNRMIEVDDDEE